MACSGRARSAMAALLFSVCAPMSRKKALTSGMLAANTHDSIGPKNEYRQNSADMAR